MTEPTDRSTEGVELLSCPFCGTRAFNLIRVYRPVEEGELRWRVVHDHEITGYACGIAGPVRDTRDEAVTGWNTRQQSSPDPSAARVPEGVREALVVAIDDALAETLNTWLSRSRGFNAPLDKVDAFQVYTALVDAKGRAIVAMRRALSAVPATPVAVGGEGLLREALVFADQQLDELINRHYGGELPCSDEEIAGFAKIRAALTAASNTPVAVGGEGQENWRADYIECDKSRNYWMGRALSAEAALTAASDTPAGGGER